MTSLITPATLPDMVAAHRELDELGYCVIPDVLNADEIASLKQRLGEQATGEAASGVATFDGGASSPNQRVWNLTNKGRIFRDLMLHPVVEAVMDHLLGKDFLLSSFTANIARTGGEPMVLHTDQIYVGFWTPQAVVANIAWMLDDFTDENGGTCLVPRSHRDGSMMPHATPGADWVADKVPTQANTIADTGKAGSILCFDGRIWHGTGANRTDTPRHALLSYHCRPFARQQETFALALDPELQASERPELLKRLGYTPWTGLGQVDKPRPEVPLYIATGRAGPSNASGSALAASI